jgi:integrase/recombinase XerC
VSAIVVPLRPAADPAAAAQRALAAVTVYLDRCKLAANTVKAYKRQTAAFVAWLAADGAAEHPDAFTDVVGAEAAVTAWRRHLLQARKAGPQTVNQALAAVTLLYEHGPQLRITIARAQVPRPGEPVALTRAQQVAVDRAARRRSRTPVRDTAVIAVLRYCGARVEECARLDAEDITITARTGTVRLHGKGDQVRTVPIPAPGRTVIAAWLRERGNHPGPLWTGQRGRLTISGITQLVLAVGAAAGIPGLRPHRLRDTYATELRLSGADPAQIQALLGHATLETTARYFRAGTEEQQRVVERAFG